MKAITSWRDAEGNWTGQRPGARCDQLSLHAESAEDLDVLTALTAALFDGGKTKLRDLIRTMLDDAKRTRPATEDAK
jgi:hypothetical protein